MTPPLRSVVWQAIAATVLSIGLLAIDRSQGIAGLNAALVIIVPSAYFAWRAGVERLPAALLVQGIGKMGMTIVLLGVTMAFCRPAPLGFFTVFVALQLVHAIAGAIGASGRSAGMPRAPGSRQQATSVGAPVEQHEHALLGVNERKSEEDR